MFAAPFSAIAVSAAQDLWEVVAPSDAAVVIHEVRFGQYSDFGDAAAEILSVVFRVGDDTGGSGGGSITPLNIDRRSGKPAASSTVERNNTTQASGGSILLADAWNIQAPFLYLPSEESQRIVIPASGRFVVAITAPADAITMNGTIIFEEVRPA